MSTQEPTEPYSADALAKLSPSHAADLQRVGNLPKEQQVRVNDRVISLIRTDGMSHPDALATALSELPHTPTPDELLEISRDTPAAAEDSEHARILAARVRKQSLEDMAEFARSLAQPSIPSDERI